MQALSQDPNFTAAAGDYVGGMKADLEEEIKAQADAMAEDSTGVDTTLGDDDDELDDLDDDDIERGHRRRRRGGYGIDGEEKNLVV